MKYRLLALIWIIAALGVGYFVYSTEADPKSRFPFQLGLDLQGGAHLVYEADVSELAREDIPEVMSSLREVIERRIDDFGVLEPVVQQERVGMGEDASYRLIIELPGVTDLDEALERIAETPELVFKTPRPEGEEREAITQAHQEAQEAMTEEGVEWEDLVAEEPLLEEDPNFVPSELTGRYLNRANVVFVGQTVREPAVSLEFDREGTELFAQLTEEYLEEPIAISLDGEILSAPVVRQVITDGRAEISGGFGVDEANELARNLNLGALPVPISLLSTQTIGPSLGEEVLSQGVFAAIVGLILLSIFMVLWYRLPGVVAVLALAIYVAVMLAVFKLIPITLTAAGIAGFILSLGIAVDANILIFERMKEELRGGKSISEAVTDGFSRAWLSIRDSNLSSIISAIILFYFGTSLIQGFALTFGLGVLLSMLTAITITRTLLLSLGAKHKTRVIRFLFGSGLQL